MSGDNPLHDPPDSDDDRRLRELLGQQAGTTSNSHDEPILAAAREAGQAIHRRKDGRDRRSKRWRLWTLPLAAAATVIIGVYVASGPGIAPGVGPDTMLRGTPTDAVVPAHRSTLAAAPELFSWRDQPAATAYRVILRNADANTLWSAEVAAGASVALPGDIRTRLETGATYLWTVEVESPIEQAILGPYWFRLEP